MQTPLPVPYVFPVINIIGGPPGPDRNGGTWRPVKWWMFFQERVPAYLCSVMHGLDYRVQGAAWQEWISKPFDEWLETWMTRTEYPGDPNRHDTGYPFRSWMRHWPAFQRQPQPYRPLAFVDSGGYSLMNKAKFKQAHDWYGVDTSAVDILALQLRMGAGMVASLDYPLPRGLSQRASRDRQESSLDNAAELMRIAPWGGPFPYLAVHGTTRDEARSYVESLLRRIDRSRPFGLAIGSLVPRSGDPRTVVEIVQGVADGLSSFNCRVPIHAFGITSHLMGFLTHLGVTSFDSTAYETTAENGGWMDSDLRPVHVRDLTEDHLSGCSCTYCSGILALGILPRIQQILKRDGQRPTGNDRYYHELLPGEYCTQSDLYALLAMHNWQQIQRERRRIEGALHDDRLPQYLAELSRDHTGDRGRGLTDALAWLAEARMDSRLRTAMRDVLGRIVTPVERVLSPVVERSQRTPDEFRVPDEYRPPAGRDVLLLIACSKEKPYRTSAHQQQVLSRLQSAFPQSYTRIHKVTVSGLYGPVPAEFEDKHEVVDYDYLLEAGADEQATVVADRLTDYLARYGARYTAVIAYIYFPAYRAVVERSLRGMDSGRVTPAKVRRGRHEEEYLADLVCTMAGALGVEPATQLSFNFEEAQHVAH